MKVSNTRSLEKLWLIDDDANEEVLVRRALRSAHLPVQLDVFADPEKAIKALERPEHGLPGLIVCDLKLPGMDGIQFLDWLRSSRFSLIPLVIRSNSDQQRDVNAAYEHGANSYIRKGFDIPTIQDNFQLLLRYWSTMSTPQVQKPAN